MPSAEKCVVVQLMAKEEIIFIIVISIIIIFIITRQKWEVDDEIMFDTEEEAIIGQNIIEEVLGSV